MPLPGEGFEMIPGWELAGVEMDADELARMVRLHGEDWQEKERRAEEQRAAARRGASRMLVERHHFLKVPVTLGMEESWLHVPPFARVEDLISCALKEPELFPSSFDKTVGGPTVDGVLAGGCKLRRVKMAHMGDQQFQTLGLADKEMTLAEMMIEQGDGLILEGPVDGGEGGGYKPSAAGLVAAYSS